MDLADRISEQLRRLRPSGSPIEGTASLRSGVGLQPADNGLSLSSCHVLGGLLVTDTNHGVQVGGIDDGPKFRDGNLEEFPLAPVLRPAVSDHGEPETHSRDGTASDGFANRLDETVLEQSGLDVEAAFVFTRRRDHPDRHFPNLRMLAVVEHEDGQAVVETLVERPSPYGLGETGALGPGRGRVRRSRKLAGHDTVRYLTRRDRRSAI